jgi:hypothetical protein
LLFLIQEPLNLKIHDSLGALSAPKVNDRRDIIVWDEAQFASREKVIEASFQLQLYL